MKIRTAIGCVAALLVLIPATSRAQDDASVFQSRRMPYAAFDQLPATHVKIGATDLVIGFAPGALDLQQAAIIDWMAASARIVAAYYGRLPVTSVRILVVPAGGAGVLSGTTFQHRGAAIRLVLGRGTTLAALNGDWKFVHELVHLAFPNVPEAHHWIEEGLASYVEPVARAQVGELNADDVWRQFIKGMPKGLPAAGDRGLDHTPTWGRTYWGGALFCLLADIAIRERTGNRKSLQDAARAIVEAGGNVEANWPVERALRIGDEGAGVPVLLELYGQMKASPVDVDLPLLWRRLGVSLQGEMVVYDNDAPLAAVRQSITQRRVGGPPARG